MTAIPRLETFLVSATGLSRQRAAYLYRVGHPWPLFTTQDERRARIYAQAHGVPFTDAMAAVDRANDAEELDLMWLMNDIERAIDRSEARQKAAALALLPCLKEVLDHSQRVVSLTQEHPGTIFRLCHAIQRFAEAHPGWVQDEPEGAA